MVIHGRLKGKDLIRAEVRMSRRVPVREIERFQMRWVRGWLGIRLLDFGLGSGVIGDYAHTVTRKVPLLNVPSTIISIIMAGTEGRT